MFFLFMGWGFFSACVIEGKKKKKKAYRRAVFSSVDFLRHVQTNRLGARKPFPVPAEPPSKNEARVPVEERVFRFRAASFQARAAAVSAASWSRAFLIMKCRRLSTLASDVPESKSRKSRFIFGYRRLTRFSMPFATM